MPNDFQTIESGSGLLKNDYMDGEATRSALKKKRLKLTETKLGPEVLDEQEEKVLALSD